MEVATLNLTLGNAQRPFQYRKGVDDEIVVARVLKDSSFNFGPLRRAGELSDLYRRLIRTGKTPLIVDTKANFGASAVYFAHSFEQAHLVAVEPEQDNFDLLVANTAGLPVECLHAAASATALDKDRPSAALPADGVMAPGGGINLAPPVPSVTINEIYEKHEQDSLPFIVKMDMEANGAGLFAANTEWIGRTPIIIIVLHDGLIPGTENSRAFVEYIANFNRDFVYIEDNIFSIFREIVIENVDV